MAWNKKLLFLLRSLAEYADRYIRKRIRESEVLENSQVLKSLIEEEIGKEEDSEFPNQSNEELRSAVHNHRNELIRRMLRLLFLKKPYVPIISQTTLIERLDFFEQYNLTWSQLIEVIAKKKMTFNNYLMEHHSEAVQEMQKRDEEEEEIEESKHREKVGNKLYRFYKR